VKQEIASTFEAARQAEQRLLEAVAEHGYSDSETFAIKLAVEEALINAIRHGNGMDPAKRVAISFDVNADRAVVTVADEGKGFRLADVPDPTADENLEKPRGRGIMLIRAYMDEVVFNDRGNQVRLTKHKGTSSP